MTKSIAITLLLKTLFLNSSILGSLDFTFLTSPGYSPYVLGMHTRLLPISKALELERWFSG